MSKLKETLVVPLKQHQIREDAMVRSGISPAKWARALPTKVQTDRKHAAKTGYAKHKARQDV